MIWRNPSVFFKAGEWGIERETGGTQWTPFPSLAYLKFLTLEGVCGLNRRQSFALFLQRILQFFCNLWVRGAHCHKSFVLFYINITFFMAWKGPPTPVPHKYGEKFFLIVLGAWQWHPITSLLVTRNQRKEWLKEKKKKKRTVKTLCTLQCYTVFDSVSHWVFIYSFN